MGLAFTELDDIIDYIKEHSVVTVSYTHLCGGSSSDSSAASDDATTGSVAATTTESGDAAETTDGALNYASIKLGEDYTDITTTIHVFNQRTDMSERCV